MPHTTKRTPTRKPRAPLTRIDKLYKEAKDHCLVNGIAKSVLDQVALNEIKEMIHNRRELNDHKREEGEIYKENATPLQEEYEFFLRLWRWKHYTDTDTNVF